MKSQGWTMLPECFASLLTSTPSGQGLALVLTRDNNHYSKRNKGMPCRVDQTWRSNNSLVTVLCLHMIHVRRQCNHHTPQIRMLLQDPILHAILHNLHISVNLLCKMEIIPKPLPGDDLLYGETRISIG